MSLWAVASLVALDYLIAFLGSQALVGTWVIPDQETGIRAAYIVRFILAGCFVLFAVRRGTARWQDFGIRLDRWRADLWWSARALAAAFMLVVPCVLMAGRTADLFPGSPWFLVDSLIAFPVVEELIYCGIVLGVLLNRLGPSRALLINVPVFCYLHIGPYGGGPYLPAILLWACLGLVLEGVYCLRRSLLCNVMLHAGANMLLILWQQGFSAL